MLSRAAALPPAVAPLVSERLSDRLATLLGRDIGAGTFRPGERLPTEDRLAAAHGVSRTVVREAVHQLKSRGLLRSRQGSGVYVTDAPPGHALTLDLSVIGSLDDVMRIREVRRALEAETAALAAQRATAAQVAELRRALRAIDRSVAEGRDGVEEDLSSFTACSPAPRATRTSGACSTSSASTPPRPCASPDATTRRGSSSSMRCTASTPPSSTRWPRRPATARWPRRRASWGEQPGGAA